MAHSHWTGGPVCRFRTKRECDEFAKMDEHYHPGMPCELWLKPGKKGKVPKRETCSLEPVRKAEYLKALGLPVEGRGFCLACEYGGPHHGGTGCKRATDSVARGVR